MTSPKGDPTYIKNKDRFFIDVAKTIAQASTHPKYQGGCIVVRNREIIGDGRSLLTHTKVEIDPVAHAIACACSRGTPTVGAEIFTTRYPFSASVFQAHVMGVKRIVVQAHQWEPYYKDEFRRAARLAREIAMPIEPIFDNPDPRFNVNTYDHEDNDQDLYTEAQPYAPDEFDTDPPKDSENEDTTTV